MRAPALGKLTRSFRSPRGAGVATICLAGSLLAGSAAAQDADKSGEAQRRLQLKTQQLEATQQREKSLRENVASLSTEREKLNAQLVETAGLIQASEAKLTAMESRLGELEAQERLLRGSLEQRHDSIAKLLGALQRMGRNPPPVVITRREDALTMVRSAMLLAAMFPELRTQALELAGRLNELVRVMTDIRAESERLRVETARLNDARMRLSGLMENKRQSLAEQQAELEQVRKVAAELFKSVTDISELIHKFDKAVEEHTGLGAYQKEAQQAAATPAPQTAPPAQAAPSAEAANKGPSAKEPATGETKMAALVPPKITPPSVELAPRGGFGSAASPGRLKPAMAFHLARAQLPIPAQGRRVLSFGDKTQYGSQSKGIVIETRHTAQITAPCDGWVVYAGEFRTYGQLLIINAGGGYHVLLAGLSQIDVQLGQFVLASEPVGTMATAPKTAAGKSGQPVLYVEFRKDGRPVDPDPWWAESHQKVQG